MEYFLANSMNPETLSVIIFYKQRQNTQLKTIFVSFIFNIHLSCVEQK